MRVIQLVLLDIVLRFVPTCKWFIISIITALIIDIYNIKGELKNCSGGNRDGHVCYFCMIFSSKRDDEKESSNARLILFIPKEACRR